MATEPDRERTGDPMEAIARSLANIEAMWRDELKRREEDRQEFHKRQKEFDAIREKTDARWAEQLKAAKTWRSYTSSDSFMGFLLITTGLLMAAVILVLVTR
jgi:predicted ATPase